MKKDKKKKKKKKLQSITNLTKRASVRIFRKIFASNNFNDARLTPIFYNQT